MLKYQCRKCGRIIEPEGKGCTCGEPFGSLKVVSDNAYNETEHQEFINQWPLSLRKRIE